MMNTDIAREAIQELQEAKKAWEDSVNYAHKLELRVQELEKTEGHFKAELNAAKNDYARHKELKATSASLLEALENLLRCSEYKATDYCQDCVPAANEAICKAKSHADTLKGE